MTYKKFFKIFFLLFLFWAASILTILRNFKGRVELSENQIYETAWNHFRMQFAVMNTTSPFAVWQQLDAVKSTTKSRPEFVKGYDFPPGINGRPVNIEENVRGTVRVLIKKGWENHAFNQFVSDLIPMNRTLPDFRDKGCQSKFPKNLPEASIIICFHNEAWSTLLRTIQSVLSRTPSHLLKEILLIDDFSSMSHLKGPLEDFVRTIPKLLLIRSIRRMGLIKARNLGAKQAISPVIVFLDSHCECTQGWLEPLLDRIARDNTTVVSPVIDSIHDNTFEYIPQDVNDLRIGGFNWDLKFTWRAIPREILAKRKNSLAPLRTPTISGGLYAINKDFFKILGFYDDGFEIWGAENLELSFKVWMCGGTLEIIPCSHVGHVFRREFPYENLKLSVKKNFVRLAEVWLDDYAKYYFERIGNLKGNYGNVAKRKQLRKELNCKSFEWYLHNVYPQQQIPEKYVASGQIYNTGIYTMCLDASIANLNYQETVKLLPCHFEGGNQNNNCTNSLLCACYIEVDFIYPGAVAAIFDFCMFGCYLKDKKIRNMAFWVYTKDGEIRRDDMCLDYIINTVMLFFCRGRVATQIWLYDNKTENIRNMKTQNCLQVVQANGKNHIVLHTCSTSSAQKWIMENYNINRLTPELQISAKMQM